MIFWPMFWVFGLIAIVSLIALLIGQTGYVGLAAP